MADLTVTIAIGANSKVLTVPDAKVADFQTAWLQVNPNNEKDENGDPKYNALEWFTEVIKRKAVRDYQVGKRRILEAQDAGIDNNIIQES